MNLPRREFLKATALSAAANLVGISSFGAESPAGIKSAGIGIILNTVDKEMKADYQKTLRRLAEIGYRHIETGRHFGDSASSFLSFLSSLNLNVLASGSTMGNLKKDAAKSIETAKGLKAKYLVCYWPWLTSAQNLTRTEVLEAAENCNLLGKQCNEAGLRFAVHNHDKEFKTFGDETAYDVLLHNTRPELVTMQLDVYWAAKAGADPVQLVKKHPGRIELIHAKDMDRTSERGMVCVGDGTIDFQSLLIEAAKSGTRYVIVEHDRPNDGLKCAEDSFRHLNRLHF